MNVTLLLVVIALQVLVFQFLGVCWSRVLPRYLVGHAEIPEDVAELVRGWEERAGRARRLLGTSLLLIATVAGLVGADTAWGKPVLAGVSAVSAVAFLAGFVRDRGVLAALAARMPTPTIRTATLEPRTLVRAYAPAWESLPLAIVALTLAATVWATAGGGSASLFWLPGLQLVVAEGRLLLSRWYARSSQPLPQRVLSSLGDPRTALAIDAWLRMLELRALLGAKISIVLLLAVKQGGIVLVALGRDAPGASSRSSGWWWPRSWGCSVPTCSWSPAAPPHAAPTERRRHGHRAGLPSVAEVDRSSSNIPQGPSPILPLGRTGTSTGSPPAPTPGHR